MKKYIILFALLFACQIGYSQKYSVNELFKKFSKTERSEKVKLGKFMMSFAGMFTETMGVNGIEVYEFDDCSSEVKDKLDHAIQNLKDPAYETMITSNDEGERTKILVKIEKDVIRELIVLTTGESHALVRIKGKIKPSDIEQITEKHGKGGC